MKVVDTIPTPKGHWTIDVYDGDPERAPLTYQEKLENRFFAQMFPDAPYPMHIGRIVSKPIDHYEGDNVITTRGKGLLLDRVFGLSSVSPLTHMGVGNSNAGAAVGDTQLLGSAPAPFLKAFDALPTRSGLVVTATTTYLTTDSGSDMNWQEIGLFNGPTNGTSTLFNRISPIGPFNKTAAVSLVPSVTITQQ